jgi:hypothetical protein
VAEYQLIDRKNGCRLVPAFNGPGFMSIQAESQEEAEAMAIECGFNSDWATGDYHLVDVNEALAGSGLKLKEVHRG